MCLDNSLPMKLVFCVIGLFLVELTAVFGQIDTAKLETFRIHEDTLEVLADGIVSDNQEERLAYCELFIKHLVKTLKEPGSYDYPFEYFENISILHSGDEQFRIFTWQLEVAEGDYRYYGAIQMNDTTLKLFPLIDRSFKMKNPEQERVTNDNWYGSVYYKILPFFFNNKPHYLLFGYDMHDYYNRKKILDVLYFDEDGNPFFGAPVFKYDEHLKHRFLLEFTGDANVRLNFDDDLGMVVFDHLILREGSQSAYVPDGSYSGFKYIDDNWVFQEKIFDQVSAKPPHEVPLTEERLRLTKPDTSRRKY